MSVQPWTASIALRTGADGAETLAWEVVRAGAVVPGVLSSPTRAKSFPSLFLKRSLLRSGCDIAYDGGLKLGGKSAPIPALLSARRSLVTKCLYGHWVRRPSTAHIYARYACCHTTTCGAVYCILLLAQLLITRFSQFFRLKASDDLRAHREATCPSVRRTKDKRLTRVTT
jgi:hypothetical protein